MSESYPGNRSEVPGVDRSKLTPIVRRVLESDFAQIVDWRAELLHGTFSAASFTGGGIFRFAGTARDRGEIEPWSVVLKASGIGSEEPTSRYFWRRELLAYESGLLGELPSGLAAPRFLGGEEREGQRTWLWLEEIKAENGRQPWPLSRYGLAARHIGRLNGAYLTDRPLPSYPWLSRDLIREPNTMLELSVEEMWRRYPTVRDHPIVRRIWPGDVGERAHRVWKERETFLAALDRLPQTLAHLDFVRGNLLARRRADGVEETVAVDWAFMGSAAIGHDVQYLGRGNAFTSDVEPDQLPDLGGIVFDGYVEGLRDSGWNGDIRLARLGFAASLALGAAWPEAVWMTLDQAKQVARMQGKTVEEMAETQLGKKETLLGLADEARELLPLVG